MVKAEWLGIRGKFAAPGEFHPALLAPHQQLGFNLSAGCHVHAAATILLVWKAYNL